MYSKLHYALFKVSDYLQERIKNANKTYFMLQKFLEIKLYLKELKLRLKNTAIDKTLTYASESWILTEIESK